METALASETQVPIQEQSRKSRLEEKANMMATKRNDIYKHKISISKEKHNIEVIKEH